MRFGVDVGGTTVKIGVVEGLEIVDTFVINTKKETLFDDVCLGLKKYIEEKNITNVEGIGFGLPGHVVNNHINFLPNIGIENIELKDYMDKYLPGIPFNSTNDANAAALGEALYDTNKPNSSYMVTLGTGVGGGFVYNGKVVDGAHSSCGEIGHIYIDHIHEYQCGCGLKGCLETVASATGVVRLAKEYFNKYKTTLNYDTMSCKDVLDAAKAGDELGLFVLDFVGKSLARGLATIQASCDVEVFFIGGGVAAAGEILIDAITKYYKQYAFKALRDTPIKLAKLGNKAGILGAAYTA